jgi:hypothetical protein
VPLCVLAITAADDLGRYWTLALNTLHRVFGPGFDVIVEPADRPSQTKFT